MKLFEQELSLVNIIETIRNIKNRNIRNRQFCKKKFRLLLLICWYIFYFDRYDHLVVSLIYLHLIVCNLKKIGVRLPDSSLNMWPATITQPALYILLLFAWIDFFLEYVKKTKTNKQTKNKIIFYPLMWNFSVTDNILEW